MALLIPQWTFRLVRKVLSVRPESLPDEVRLEDAIPEPVRAAIDPRRKSREVIGMTLSYVPAIRQSQCGSCRVRWVMYDAGTLRVYWSGPGWPRRRLSFNRREAQPGRLWVPLPTRPGKFVVKVEVVRSTRKDGAVTVRSRAGADSAVIELAKPANPPAKRPRK